MYSLFREKVQLFRGMHSAMYAYSAGGAVNLAAEAKAEQVYKAFEGTVMLAL